MQPSEVMGVESNKNINLYYKNINWNVVVSRVVFIRLDNLFVYENNK